MKGYVPCFPGGDKPGNLQYARDIQEDGAPVDEHNSSFTGEAIPGEIFILLARNLDIQIMNTVNVLRCSFIKVQRSCVQQTENSDLDPQSLSCELFLTLQCTVSIHICLMRIFLPL